MMFFFFNDPATTEIYTLSLHDALPISPAMRSRFEREAELLSRLSHPNVVDVLDRGQQGELLWMTMQLDRKSTRLNSSHANISYAVFCLKKKNISTSVFSITNMSIAVSS